MVLTPAIAPKARSSGVATVDAMTSGLAPGKLAATRIGGVVMQYAPTHEEKPAIDLDLVHFKELVLTGAIRHDKESFRQAVRLLGSGQVDFSDLALAFGNFETLEAEMKRADEDRGIHRILLRWPD